MLAWSILVIALIHPPHGLGIDVCLFHATSGISCVGCGLTRSISCAIRGMAGWSFSYHPFGYVLLGWAAGKSVYCLLPRRAQKRIVAAGSPIWFAALSKAVIAAFLVFGVARTVGSLWP
jgi:hypothetical protein